MLPNEESKLLKAIESSGLDLNSSQMQVEVDYEVRTIIDHDLISSQRHGSDQTNSTQRTIKTRIPSSFPSEREARRESWKIYGGVLPG